MRNCVVAGCSRPVSEKEFCDGHWAEKALNEPIPPAPISSPCASGGAQDNNRESVGSPESAYCDCYFNGIQCSKPMGHDGPHEWAEDFA